MLLVLALLVYYSGMDACTQMEGQMERQVEGQMDSCRQMDPSRCRPIVEGPNQIVCPQDILRSAGPPSSLLAHVRHSNLLPNLSGSRSSKYAH